MKKTLILFWLLSFQICGAQSFKSKPDYKKIEVDISNKNSNFYFEKLMKRFVEADSTMTLDEKQHLYFGYAFTKDYNPYDRSDANKEVNGLLDNPDSTKIDYKKAIGICEKQLKKTPFDLRLYNSLLYCLEMTKNKVGFTQNLVRFRTVLDAILQSGDGKTEDTSFYVIYVSHEYDVISILGLRYGGEQSLINHYDYLKLEKNEYNLEGLYFDISPSLEFLNKKLK